LDAYKADKASNEATIATSQAEKAAYAESQAKKAADLAEK